MANRIDALNQRLKASGGKSLSVVVMIGDGKTMDVVQWAVDAGVDVVELGMPTANPFLDSPVMRDSMARALKWSSDPRRYLDAIAQVRKKFPTLPLEIMIYRDTLAQIGIDAYAAALGDAGADATLVADIADQTDLWRERLDFALNAKGVTALRFLPHGFTSAQLDDVRAKARGFVIVQTAVDSDGQRPSVLDINGETLSALRADGIRLPLILAYGIRTDDDVRRALALGADGVLIGTALLDAAHNQPKKDVQALLARYRAAAL